MLVRVVLLFLVLMAALAMFGKLKLPSLKPPSKRLEARKCPKCGSYKVGKGPCNCGHGG